MPDFTSPTQRPIAQSIHHDRVNKAIPDWLRETSPARVSALKDVTVKVPDWHRSATPVARQRLNNAVSRQWAAQNDIDQTLRDLQDIRAFAKPLLQAVLKNHYGIEDDVEETWLRLYAPPNTSWWVIDVIDGTTSRTLSLLDAALHNFSSKEGYTDDSEFISRPDARGHFSVKPLKQKLSIPEFMGLCRELDLGARYQKHLNRILFPTHKVASNVLRHKIILGQKSALNAAAHMALIKHDIDQSAYDVVRGMLDDRAQLQWNGQPIGYYNLAMMDTRLSSILLICADPANANAAVPVIAYVPHDPQHPLKQYPSSLALMDELTRQLREGGPGNSYQQFFSQFVPQEQRGHFFAGVNARLSTITWQPVASGSSLPTWRESAVSRPNLQFAVSSIKDDPETPFKNDLWGYRYRQTLNKILNDAREIAISTEYVDRMARWAWWDNLEKMLSDILNVALLVATPLVPGLGTLMMAYTAYQLTEEVVEGVVDLAEGHLAEAGEQIIDVLESVVQLGTFAAAGAVGNVARAKLSPFFEGLKPVQLANGESRLWNPDLSPYQRTDVALAADARPDAQGLHQHQGRRILPLDNQHFDVVEDPVTGQQRIRHPRRAEAYAPTLRHNGQGAWVCETENPREWEGPALMRRLGHSTEGFSDEQLEEIRQISGSTEAELRRIHVDSATPPPLLTDTLQRLASPAIAAAALPAEIAPLFSEFPELPATVAEEIIAGASGSERQRIEQEKRLPLHQKTQARELQFETQAVRAAQGLYPDAPITADTERLVLGALRLNTDTFGDLRLEVRQGAFDGELRCSAGPEDASKVRVLIRDDAGQYQVRDGADQPIHAADDFFEAVLQATQENGQTALGYKSGDGEMFRQWVMVKSEPPSVRRTVLATPPVRAVVERETMLLVRGGGLTKEGKTLRERVQDLHPHFSEVEVDTFANALTAKGEPTKLLEEQEHNLDQLRKHIELWEAQSAGLDADNPLPMRGVRKHIADRLLNCFERKNTELGGRTDPQVFALDLSSDFLPLDLQSEWPKSSELQQFLDKVTILKLDNTRFSSGSRGLLSDFPHLVELSAKDCELKQLPKPIGIKLRRLERLRLNNNRIVLDAPAVEQLRPLTYLEVLGLGNNPLHLSPDIKRMPRLKVLDLKNTGLTRWPEGTFDKHRPRGFFLDLRGNPLSDLPTVTSGSEAEWLVARTQLSVGILSDVNQVRYQAHRRAMGLPPEPIVFPTPTESRSTISSFGAEHWGDVPGWIDRETPWSAIADEPGSEAFMEVLTSTRGFTDFVAGGPAKEQLMQRVWRLIDAVYVDTPLREKLFAMANASVEDAEAGTQLFNQMGIKVLQYEASAYSTDEAQIEQKLVTLAKGSARLTQVNDIARTDVANRGDSPNEGAVYRAYQTGLADRLNLPWQSKGMVYQPMSGVTDAMIEQAYDRVVALGEGDELVDRMLEQDFWMNHLNKQHSVKMDANKQRYQRLTDQLPTLITTQRKWTEATSDLKRAELRAQLRELMNDLPVPNTVVFTEEPLSDENLGRILSDLEDEEKGLARYLTRLAMKRAGI